MIAGSVSEHQLWRVTTVQAESPDTASELGFTGQVRLSGGLYVMGIRVYDAKLRQFLQPDVLNPMSYLYAEGDPINVIDPTGMAGEEIVITGSRYRRDHGENKTPLRPGDTVIVIEAGHNERGGAGSQTGTKLKITAVRRRRHTWHSPRSGTHSALPISTSTLAAVAVAYNTLLPELEVVAIFTGPAAPFVEAGLNIAAGVINLALLIDTLDAGLPVSVEMSKKPDTKQIDDLLKANPDISSDDFRDFLHEVKQEQGRRPDENFSWKELNLLIQEFRELNGL